MIHISFDARITIKIAVYVRLGITAGNIQLPRQTKRRHAVDEAEIYRLSAAALLVSDAIERRTEHLSGSCAMDIQAFVKRTDETLVLRQVSHNSQLNL